LQPGKTATFVRPPFSEVSSPRGFASIPFHRVPVRPGPSAWRDLPCRSAVRADHAVSRKLRCRAGRAPVTAAWQRRLRRGAGGARARQRRGRRVRRALIAPPREIRCAGRSRSRSARLGNRDRDGACLGQRVTHVLRPEQAEADSELKAGDPLKRPAALGACNRVRHRSASETQSAAWAANRGHNRPFP
jgi:hypothetical protein